MGRGSTLEAGALIAQCIKAQLTADAYWIRSYYAPEAGALYCIRDARDAEAIAAVLARAAPDFAMEGPHEIEMYDRAQDFRE